AVAGSTSPWRAGLEPGFIAGQQLSCCFASAQILLAAAESSLFGMKVATVLFCVFALHTDSNISTLAHVPSPAVSTQQYPIISHLSVSSLNLSPSAQQ